MTVYRTTGTLVDAIQPENVAVAAAYLTEDDMTQYVSPQANLEGVLMFIEWNLHSDGLNYHVTAVTNRDLDDDELKRLASTVSGQNSDGLGENFEQQAFAWNEDSSEQDCNSCSGQGYILEDDGTEISCDECGGDGYIEDGEGHMCSFDWETNDSTFVKVER